MDRENRKLMINSVHAEPTAPDDKEISSKIAEKILQQGSFSELRKSHTHPASLRPGRILFAESNISVLVN
jgi:hypothetical protein